MVFLPLDSPHWALSGLKGGDSSDLRTSLLFIISGV